MKCFIPAQGKFIKRGDYWVYLEQPKLIDFDAAAMHVKGNFLIGYLVANETKAPEWNMGDFFGTRFKR